MSSSHLHILEFSFNGAYTVDNMRANRDMNAPATRRKSEPGRLKGKRLGMVFRAAPSVANFQQNISSRFLGPFKVLSPCSRVIYRPVGVPFRQPNFSTIA
jgi:hypothetical protein